MPGTVPEKLLDWVEQRLAAPAPITEALEQEPGLTVASAYAVQRALMERRVQRGDRVLGYKAALTSPAMQAREGISEPVLGTLLASLRRDEEQPISLRGFIKATVEPEVAIVLARDLAGPGVTPPSAMAAVAGYLPSIEVGDIRTVGKRTLQHTICCNTFNGGHVFGAALVAPSGIDLRREGMVLTCNGVPRGSATAVEVLGNPLHSLVFIANKLAELGLGLRAGMVVMTGSIVASIPVQPGDHVHVGFSRLGEVTARFSA